MCVHEDSISQASYQWYYYQHTRNMFGKQNIYEITDWVDISMAVVIIGWHYKCHIQGSLATSLRTVITIGFATATLLLAKGAPYETARKVSGETCFRYRLIPGVSDELSQDMNMLATHTARKRRNRWMDGEIEEWIKTTLVLKRIHKNCHFVHALHDV